MKLQSKIFGKENFKGISDDLQNEIIQRFNDYDTITRVMQTVSNNLKTLVLTTTGMNYRDKQDIKEFSKLLRQATNTQWLKENNLFF